MSHAQLHIYTHINKLGADTHMHKEYTHVCRYCERYIRYGHIL